MNDIEGLIVRANRPTPSPELDARISQVTRRPFRVSVIRTRMRRLTLFAIYTAGTVLVGFFLGRQSVAPATSINTVVTSPISTESPAPSKLIAEDLGATSARTVVELDASQAEALARFVTPPKRVEGLFGPGSLEYQSIQSRLE